MQVQWGWPPPRVVHVVGRRRRGVVCGLGSLGSSCTRGSDSATPNSGLSRHSTAWNGAERNARPGSPVSAGTLRGPGWVCCARSTTPCVTRLLVGKKGSYTSICRRCSEHGISRISQGTKCDKCVCKCPRRPCRLFLPSLLFLRRRHLGGADGEGQGLYTHAPQRKHTQHPAAPPPRRPAAPRRAPPEEAADPTAPTSIFPPRRGSRGALRRLGPVGGGAVRARLCAWAVWLSSGPGWRWSAKQ